MKKESNNFDIIVIGAGSGGLNIAGFGNRIGLKVLLIDKSGKSIGGDCLNHGCVPSKAFIHVAREIYAGKKAEQFGLIAKGSADIQKVMAYVREKQDVIREHENAEHFRKLGMTVVLGSAEFIDGNTVRVSGVDYFAKKIVIATGSRPRTLVLDGIQEVPVYTNETVFNMEVLPQRFVFIGGGPISIELGQAFAMLGCQVTIVHTGDRLLEKEHPQVSSFMEEELKNLGITVLLSAKTKNFESSELVVALPSGDVHVHADALFAGIGRVLNIENLQLEKAGIQLSADKNKIIVDEFLRTTNKNILTVGDVAGGLQFTHAAELHAKVVIQNFFSPIKKKLNTDNFGWVTYTSPEVATFGLSASELKKRNVIFQEISASVSEDDRGIVDGARGFLKVFVGKKGTLLGGTMVASNAGEIVGELMLAQSKGLTMADLFNRVSPYPTASRIVRAVAAKYQAQKLTPRASRTLKFLYSFFA